MPTHVKLSCVLFDLDGTLLDTAPDLLACLNRALQVHHLMAADETVVRPLISYGAAAMIDASQPAALPKGLHEAILTLMLDLYQQNIAEHSRFFPGMPEVLAMIESEGLKWGVVTNKRERFTLPLMAAMNLTGRAACIISGDTAGKPKPHPEPMLAACRQAGVLPEQCVYIGDAHHDMVAGKSVNMKTLAAVYGYLKPADVPETWGADALIASPGQLSAWLESALCC